MLARRAPALAAPLARRDGRPRLDHYFAIGEDRGILWTPLRRQILELLWRSARPWGAYALADELRRGNLRGYPNSVYRILAILEQARLVVNIVSSRRVQISPDPAELDWAVLQCPDCDRLELLPFTSQAAIVREAADRLGFADGSVVIECIGRCEACGTD